jgi:hypothetical protein
MRLSILSTLCLAGTVLAASIGIEPRADNYYEIISRRTQQISSTMQSLETHLRPGAPTSFDRLRQSDQQQVFFRKAIQLNDQLNNAMREATAEIASRVPRGWKMGLGEATSYAATVLSMQSELNSLITDWGKVRSAASSIGALREIANSLSTSQKTLSDFMNHILDHQNSLTSAVGLDRTAKSVIENSLSRLVREYSG